MRQIKLLTLLAAFALPFIFSPNTAHAQANGNGGDIGIGLMLGEPTGISVKSWNNTRSAFAFGAAWSFGRNDALHMHGDFLLHNWLDDVEEGELAFYYGFGARLALADPDARLGIRVPVGLNYIIPEVPLDLFIEAVPIFNLTPSTDFDGNGALGVRYYF